MLQKFYCEKCAKEFLNEESCKQHEKECQVIHTFICDKCGKEIKYITDWKSDRHDLYFNSEECWTINLGRPGYGSKLDGCDVKFNLCDDCLIELIDSLTIEGQEKVYNSGSNTYLSTEDWIRLHKGEMPDEEMEEKNLISPRQIKAYKDRFPICDKVKIKVYNDKSKGSKCFNSAFGDENGQARDTGGFAVSRCFNCPHFKEREEGQKIPIKYEK